MDFDDITIDPPGSPTVDTLFGSAPHFLAPIQPEDAAPASRKRCRSLVRQNPTKKTKNDTETQSNDGIPDENGESKPKKRAWRRRKPAVNSCVKDKAVTSSTLSHTDVSMDGVSELKQSSRTGSGLCFIKNRSSSPSVDDMPELVSGRLHHKECTVISYPPVSHVSSPTVKELTSFKKLSDTEDQAVNSANKDHKDSAQVSISVSSTRDSSVSGHDRDVSYETPTKTNGHLLYCDRCDFTTTRLDNLVFHHRQHSGKKISDYSPVLDQSEVPHCQLASSPTRPQTSPPTRPQTSPPTRPETSSPTRPQTSPPTNPQTSSPTRPQTSSPTRPQTSSEPQQCTSNVAGRRHRRSASELADLRNKEVNWNMDCSLYFNNPNDTAESETHRGGRSRGRAGPRGRGGRGRGSKRGRGAGRGSGRGRGNVVADVDHSENTQGVTGGRGRGHRGGRNSSNNNSAESKTNISARSRGRRSRRGSLVKRHKNNVKQRTELPSMDSSDESFLTKDDNEQPPLDTPDLNDCKQIQDVTSDLVTSERLKEAVMTCDPNIAASSMSSMDSEAMCVDRDPIGRRDSCDSCGWSSGSSCEDDLPDVFTPSQQANIDAGDILWVEAYGYPFWPAVVKKVYRYKTRHRIIKLSVGFISRDTMHSVSRSLVYNKKKMVIFGGDHTTHERLVREAQLSIWKEQLTESIQWVEDYLFDQAKSKVTGTSLKYFGFTEQDSDSSFSDALDDGEGDGHDNGLTPDNMLAATEAPQLEEVGSDVEMSAKLKACIDRRRERCARILDVCRGNKIKNYLTEIYRGTRLSERHNLYNKPNRSPEEDRTLKASMFGPIDDDEQQSELLNLMTDYFQKLEPDKHLFGERCLYLLHVLIPEAIVYGIQVALRRPREQAEEVFQRGVLYTREEIRQQSHDLLKDRLTEEERAQQERRLVRTAWKLGINI